MPEPYFVSDKCQEDKCLDHILFWTGICPPGICQKQNMVQAFVLLAFVQNKKWVMPL